MSFHKNMTISPLRYPGGKSRISPFIEDVMLLNTIDSCTMYELYAGGAGASLNALFSGICKKVVLNDLDFHIFAFWKSILDFSEQFIEMIDNTTVDLNSWKIQKEIYNAYQSYDILQVGFSTFFLNRCNRSGILQAGPIGGLNQTGNYKINVRFNKDDLKKRIMLIASKRDSIEIYNHETISFLKTIFSDDNDSKFIFLDPPYYSQGENLYFSYYEDHDHQQLSQILKENKLANWFLTYDNSDRIKKLYGGCKMAYLPMTYTLQRKSKTNEIMIFSDSLASPRQIKIGGKVNLVNMLKLI